MTTGSEHQSFHDLHTAGLEANKRREFAAGADFLGQARAAAVQAGDPRQEVNALDPLARALWNTGDYAGAREYLEEAHTIANTHDMPDEAAIARANLGRLETIQSFDLPRQERRAAIQSRALPHFQSASQQLSQLDPRHLYYDYATSGYGALGAAIGLERKQAIGHIATGFSVAFSESHGHDEGKRPAQISKAGLGRLVIAAALVPLGEYTPFLPLLARRLMK